MSPERLLQHFDQIAEAPDAVSRLRRFILDLAVRGKLVEQNPEDEPASELLERIEAESEEVTFDLPAKWMSAKAGRLLNIHYGKALSAGDRSDDGRVSVFGSNGVVGYCETALTEEPVIIIGRKGSAGALNLCDGPSWTTDVAYYLIPPPFFDIRFLLIVLQTLDLGSLGKGVKPGLNRSEAYHLPIVVPPFSEQQRIVAKVDELMALCDELEAAQAKREKRRDRLVAATLHGLNNGDESGEPGIRSTFEESARFYINQLPRFTTRPEHIQQLRQAILNLAIRGKLVPQDPNEKSADEPLMRIQSAKIRLQKEGKISRAKAFNPVLPESPRFCTPQSWRWTKLGELSELITKGSSPKWQGIDYVSEGEGVLFITSENVGNYRLRKLDALKYVDKRFNEIEPRSILKCNDIVMNLVGASIGRTAIYDLHDGANINQAVALIRLVHKTKGICIEFLLHYLNSSYAIDSMLSSRVVTAQPNISLTDVREFGVPIPPYAEQHRIVAKVDELMAMCDELESQITTTTATRNQLLEASLHEALSA